MTNSTIDTGKVNYSKYTLQYVGTYIFCMIAVLVITSLFQFDPVPAMGIIMVMASLTIPVNSFVKTHNRVFTPGERVVFSTLVAIVTLLAGVAFAYALSQLEIAAGGVDMWRAQLNELFGSIPSLPLAIALLVVAPFVVTWIVAYTAIWFFARGTLKNQLKANQQG